MPFLTTASSILKAAAPILAPLAGRLAGHGIQALNRRFGSPLQLEQFAPFARKVARWVGGDALENQFGKVGAFIERRLPIPLKVLPGQDIAMSFMDGLNRSFDRLAGVQPQGGGGGLPPPPPAPPNDPLI